MLRITFQFVWPPATTKK